MRAMAISRFGSPDELQPVDLPDPVPGPGEVLVRLTHVGTNPVDHKMRDGSSKWVASMGPDAFPLVLGREGTGVVEALGEGVADLAVGDRVFGIVPLGAYAELVAAPAAGFAKAPEGVAPEVLAGTALAGLTAWSAVHDHGQVGPDDVVLVHGAGGGVGQVAVQLARQAGAEVWGSASARHADKLRRWGVHPVDYATQDVAEVVLSPTVVVDGVYFGTYETSIAMLPRGGRLVVLPSLADLEPARAAGLEVSIPHVSPSRERLEQLGAMLADGTLEVAVGRVLPLTDVALAHRLLESGHAEGKVVLAV